YAATHGTAVVGARAPVPEAGDTMPRPPLRGRSPGMVCTSHNNPGAGFMPAPGSRSGIEWSKRVASAPRLLDLDRGAGLFELLLDRLGLVLGDSLLDGGGRRLDEVLGLLEAEARHLAHRLDDVDLLLAGRLQDHVELGLLLDGSGGCTAAGRRRSHGRRRGGDAVVLLERLDQVVELEDGQLVDLLDELFGRDSHFLSLTASIL